MKYTACKMNNVKQRNKNSKKHLKDMLQIKNTVQK